jgi:hypothetical protein
MATPFGAGLSALVYEMLLREGYRIFTSPKEYIEYVIQPNVEDAGTPGFDVRFGHGKPLVNKLVESFINNKLIGA